jgi:hypothetical protein
MKKSWDLIIKAHQESSKKLFKILSPISQTLTNWLQHNPNLIQKAILAPKVEKTCKRIQRNQKEILFSNLGYFKILFERITKNY